VFPVEQVSNISVAILTNASQRNG